MARRVAKSESADTNTRSACQGRVRGRHRVEPRADRQQREARLRYLRGTSGGRPDRDLPLADALGRVVKSLLDVFGHQVGKGIDDAETSYARESAHLVGICGDAIEPHRVLASMAVVGP